MVWWLQPGTLTGLTLPLTSSPGPVLSAQFPGSTDWPVASAALEATPGAQPVASPLPPHITQILVTTHQSLPSSSSQLTW